MNRLSVVGAIVTSFVLGATMTVAAQDEHKQQEELKKETAQPPARQDQAKPEEHRNQEPQQNEERRQEPRQDQRQMQPQQEKQQHEMQQQEKQQQKMDKQQEKMEKQQGQERREQAQPQQPNREQGRPQHAQNQRHIPEQDFHAHFGREHRFHPGRMQVNGGSPQFRYSGYMFELVEVWPTDWAYDADDYYIDYFGDEYWLCSFSHPEVRLELIIIG